MSKILKNFYIDESILEEVGIDVNRELVECNISFFNHDDGNQNPYKSNRVIPSNVVDMSIFGYTDDE